ncbi:MAG TPA: hypothetical protein VFX38_01890, partial [Gammaproteobacteria bacterium]|nr:hypothetical protein [Gammaproteobacteria bacterium]
MLFALLSSLALSFSAAAAMAAPAHRGFAERDIATRVHTMLTPQQIAAFLPERGAFTFPAPWGTRGVRITNASDCGGQDCLDNIYTYWRNLSNSAGSNTMYI